MKKANKKMSKQERKATRARVMKKAVYDNFGIDYISKNGGYINAPVFGWIKPVLKHGNDKIGNVWQLSTLPREIAFTFTVKGHEYNVCGTCLSTCRDENGKITCYGCAGHFQRHNVRASLGINTFLARYALDFLRRAIMAQIIADGIRVCRVHVTGDFFSMEYINMWREIAQAFPGVVFWSYTKNPVAEHAFDDIENFHVVPSKIPGKGYNYGHCNYILALFDYLTKKGFRVFVCMCGFDDENPAHCDTCGACRTCDYVLFLEHSTNYNAKEDPLYPVLKAMVLAQEKIAA